MKVLLVCAAGMSTSLLTNNMRKNAGPHDVVEAIPVSELAGHAGEYDVVLLAPQIRFKEREVRAVIEPQGVPTDVIPMRAYGMMDGKAVMEQARQLYASAH